MIRFRLISYLRLLHQRVTAFPDWLGRVVGLQIRSRVEYSLEDVSRKNGLCGLVQFTLKGIRFLSSSRRRVNFFFFLIVNGIIIFFLSLFDTFPKLYCFLYVSKIILFLNYLSLFQIVKNLFVCHFPFFVYFLTLPNFVHYPFSRIICLLSSFPRS